MENGETETFARFFKIEKPDPFKTLSVFTGSYTQNEKSTLQNLEVRGQFESTDCGKCYFSETSITFSKSKEPQLNATPHHGCSLATRSNTVVREAAGQSASSTAVKLCCKRCCF